MDLHLIDQLSQPSGVELFAIIAQEQSLDPLALTTKLRKLGFAPELIAAALTQHRLRLKAETKLGPFAQRMLFTENGVEQATRLAVAAHHAQRLLRTGATKVADLTCGNGADAMAFAALGLDVLATEIDEVTAAVARENLKPFPNAQVWHADGLATDFEAQGIDAVYADPARRDGAGRRIFTPDSYLPPLDSVWALTSRVDSVGIKVGPGISHADIPPRCEAQWVSIDGDVVEAGLWFGKAATHEGFGALVLTTTPQGQLSTHVTAQGLDPQPRHSQSTSDLLEYLHEPDGAIIRAGLVAHVANTVDGLLTDPMIAYFTSNSPVVSLPPVAGASNNDNSDAKDEQAGEHPQSSTSTPHQLTTSYRVLDAIPYNVKALRSYLAERKVGRVTIKKRGISVTPEQLRPQLKLKGQNEAFVVLTRVNDHKTVIVVEPV